MALNRACWPLWVSYVPNFELLIITNCRENELIKVIPGHILYYWAMSLEIEYGLLIKLIRVGLINVPNACPAIIWSRQEQSLFERIPRKPIPLLSVTEQPQIGLDLIIDRCVGVLVVIEKIDLSAHRFGCNDILLILGHVSGSVHFTLVIDLHVNRNSGRFWICDTATANSIGIIIKHIFFVITGVFRWFKRDFDLTKWIKELIWNLADFN